MAKRNSRFYSFLFVGVLLTLSTLAAHAQIKWTPEQRQRYTNGPCANPDISWALWNESAGFTKPTGGVGNVGDCDPSHYGTWSTAPQLETNLRAYRQMMARQGVSQLTFRGRDGRAYIAVRDAKGVLFGFDGGMIVAQGGGNIVPASTIVAQGGGNIVAQGGGNIVAQGGGNFRGVMATGERIVQFPGRWVKLK